eukprot:g22523.t1
MVAEPGKVLAPAAPPRPKPWMVILALFLIMIGDGVEPVDDIMYEEVNLVDFPFENLETEQDVTKDERDDKDWCPVKDGLDLSHSSVMDFEVNFMRCIGATEILAVEGPWANGQLKAEPMERGSTSRVEDWRSDSLDFEDFNTETVRDWGLDQTVDSFESFTQNKSTVTDYFLRYAKVVENAIGDLVFDLERYSVTLQAFEVDDPLRFVSWSDNFKNWLTYGDHKYVELLKQVEELDEPCTLAEFASEEVVELGHRVRQLNL